MVEPKISLSLLVPGAGMLSSQECDKNPKKNYSVSKMTLKYPVSKGKKPRYKTEILTIKERKNRLVTQNITICEEAYKYMLATPMSKKYLKAIKRNKDGLPVKRVWDTLTVHEKLKDHFDLIAHDFRAESYSYEILGD